MARCCVVCARCVVTIVVVVVVVEVVPKVVEAGRLEVGAADVVRTRVARKGRVRVLVGRTVGLGVAMVVVCGSSMMCKKYVNNM